MAPASATPPEPWGAIGRLALGAADVSAAPSGVERLGAYVRDATAVLTFLDLKFVETAIQERLWIEILDAAAAKVQQVDDEIADRVSSFGSGSVAKRIDGGLGPISSFFVDGGVVI
jgi:hypothetical protein